MNIILTGANQGIGYYMASELLRKGNNVTVLDIETSALIQLQQEFDEHFLPIECDVRNVDAVESAVSQSVAWFGGVDVAVHNACLCTFESLENTRCETYREVFDVNYFGALSLAKAVIPFMKQNERGKIIFTGSGVGVTGFYNISPYASSKGAIESLAKCLNLEYAGSGITFHLFHPPLTQTKSAALLPVPAEMKARPEVVGKKLAQKIYSKKFVICHSMGQQMQVSLCYLFPLTMGKLMTMMTKKSTKG